MKNLGPRLETVYSLILSDKQADLFADIGSDHAYLAVEAVERKAVKNAIASDINPKPLEKGRKYALKCGVDIEFILSDGFDAFDGRKIDTAAICGMGGELIADIISRSSAAKSCKLILQPMTAQDDLRRFLWNNGFCIGNEVFTVENKKPYVILSAYYCGNNTKYSYSDLFLGKTRPKSEEYAEYVRKVLSSAKKRRLSGEATALIDGLINDCQTQITYLSPAND